MISIEILIKTYGAQLSCLIHTPCTKIGSFNIERIISSLYLFGVDSNHSLNDWRLCLHANPNRATLAKDSVPIWIKRIKQEPKAATQNCRNQTLQFGKPDALILLGPMAVRGTIRFRWIAPPLTKWSLDGGEARTTKTQGVGVMASRSNQRKEEKTRAKHMKK
jgi:hypothetical protein